MQIIILGCKLLSWDANYYRGMQIIILGSTLLSWDASYHLGMQIIILGCTLLSWDANYHLGIHCPFATSALPSYTIEQILLHMNIESGFCNH